MATPHQFSLPSGLTYTAYRTLIDTLFAEQKATGDNHSEAMLHYTKLNVARMRRLDKTIRILPEVEAQLATIDRPLRWLTLTEGWCGDAAQIVPILEKMAALNPHLQHELILRDQHLELMDQFLTNGARAIPLTIIADAQTNTVLGYWGPRPVVPQNLVMTAKAEAAMAAATDRKAIMDIAKLEAQKWYTRDKGRAVQEEFMTALLATLQN